MRRPCTISIHPPPISLQHMMLHIHSQESWTCNGKKISPPLKNSQKIFPPPLSGCPWGDFPPPIWNFQELFLFSSPLKISYIKKFNKLSWKRHGKIFFPPQNELKNFPPPKIFLKNFSMRWIFPPPLATCLCMYDFTKQFRIVNRSK